VGKGGTNESETAMNDWSSVIYKKDISPFGNGGEEQRDLFQPNIEHLYGLGTRRRTGDRPDALSIKVSYNFAQQKMHFLFWPI